MPTRQPHPLRFTNVPPESARMVKEILSILEGSHAYDGIYALMVVFLKTVEVTDKTPEGRAKRIDDFCIMLRSNAEQWKQANQQ